MPASVPAHEVPRHRPEQESLTRAFATGKAWPERATAGSLQI